MKKNVILSLVFITLILLIGFCACSCEHNYMEGFTQIPATSSSPITYSIPLTHTIAIKSITAVSELTTTNVLIESDTGTGTGTVIKTLVNSDYCAILETANHSAKGLMILKVISHGSPAVEASLDGVTPAAPAVPGVWNVIWASNLSNELWYGSPLTLAINGTLKIGGNNKIAVFTVPTDGTGTLALTLVDGDLLIKQGTKVVWSLLDSELNSAKSEVETYMKSNETVRATLNAKLKDKLQNLNTYYEGIKETLTASDELASDLTNYQKMVDIRHKMDFELSEINGTSGSKLNISQTTLQSTMYVNLAISVLAVSLFVLIYSR